MLETARCNNSRATVLVVNVTNRFPSPTTGNLGRFLSRLAGAAAWRRNHNDRFPLAMGSERAELAREPARATNEQKSWDWVSRYYKLDQAFDARVFKVRHVVVVVVVVEAPTPSHFHWGGGRQHSFVFCLPNSVVLDTFCRGQYLTPYFPPCFTCVNALL